MPNRRRLLLASIAAGMVMPNAGVRKKILVDNPAKLYGF